MKNFIQQFLRDEEGAAAIEYALMAGLIACGIIAGATTLGSDISNFFSTVGTTINSKAPS